METTARNRTIGGIVIAAIILILLLVLFSCTVTADLQGYGYTYHRDAQGYVATVDVPTPEEIPPEWDCHPKDGAFRTLTCDIRVDGAQGPDADGLTRQEIEALVREEVARIEDTPKVEPKQERDSPSDASPIDWPSWIMAVVAVATLVWLVFTQRDHIPALVKKVRRPFVWLRRRLEARMQITSSGPGPLRRKRGWRPDRRGS
ncbi:hypothetical protein J2S40_003075 [Nocardioides luteus]|uniref:DUF4333 domain-containing protein n=1 Tax=Nocardioides luteus TaxID=1844 RepID=A0ABQ5SVP7_9ACTN|nr:hypothetical protein [Nocardioides luteus]MDR7312017.1 hypothetical protein [Nocardioides luteus]GGR71972.1 hypothetical protein GCM10010197_44210 [Nocardioides luteus]GLJ68263.1 hypothetical protein GCM10017579_22990 [Nocardioides luteus]